MSRPAPIEAELRRGEVATWGPRPDVGSTRLKMRLRSWKRIEKPGSSLVGLAGIALPVGGTWLEIDDLPVLITNGKAWTTWPAKPVITKGGTVAKLPGTSKVQYVNILRWGDRETSQRFSQAVVDLVRQRDPQAFGEAAP